MNDGIQLFSGKHPQAYPVWYRVWLWVRRLGRAPKLTGENLEQVAWFRLLSDRLDRLEEPRQQPDSIQAVRHALGSVDLSDAESELTEAEQRQHNAAIAAVLHRLERDVKKFLYDQLLFTANEADTWERVVFGRGSFNGMDLLLEHWRRLAAEHRAALKPKEPFDPHSPVPEIDAK